MLLVVCQGRPIAFANTGRASPFLSLAIRLTTPTGALATIESAMNISS